MIFRTKFLAVTAALLLGGCAIVPLPAPMPPMYAAQQPVFVSPPVLPPPRPVFVQPVVVQQPVFVQQPVWIQQPVFVQPPPVFVQPPMFFPFWYGRPFVR